jgi:SAM-dependent methyltransferase
MPSIADNLAHWDTYSWEHGGEEWSHPWGNSAFQWSISIYPRLMSALPACRIVEIAPGFGRWTPFLLGQSSFYVGVDISPRCVSFCQRTFGRIPERPRFLVGDGTSLPGVEDALTDLVFSFDSLVHAELDCLSAYAKEIHRVLRPGGVAFIHHSNMGEYEPGTDNPGWRGRTISAENAGREFMAAGLQVITQEKIPWVFRGVLTDCFSFLRRPLPRESLSSGRQVVNETFIRECELAAQLAALYQPH